MRKRIVMEIGNGKKLASQLHCSEEMVSMALNYKKNSLLARRIRHLALTQFGGVEIGGNDDEKKD